MIFEIRYAIKLLLSRQQGFLSLATWISFFGVFLGVLALILAISVMNGFRDQVFERLTFDGEHVIIHEPKQKIKGYNQSSIINGDVLLLSQYASMGTTARGVMGSKQLKDPWGIELPFNTVEKLGLKVGDKVTLMAPKGMETPFGWMPRKRDFLIEQLSFTKTHAEIPFLSAQKFFDRKTPTKTLITLDDPLTSTTVKKDLKEKLPQAKVTTWQEKNQTVVNALKVERVVTTLILSFIVVVAVFNIVVSHIMQAQQKRKTIAVMRAIGMSRMMIAHIFIYSGIMLAGSGALLGGGLGILITRYYDFIIRPIFDAYGAGLSGFFARLPFSLSYGFAISVVLAAVFLAMIAILYPARKASAIPPTEAFS